MSKIGRPAKETSEKAVHQVKGYVNGIDYLFVMGRIDELSNVETISQYVKYLINEDRKRVNGEI